MKESQLKPRVIEKLELAVVLNADDRITWYQCFSENFESIHNHNAYAFIERDKRISE